MPPSHLKFGAVGLEASLLVVGHHVLTGFSFQVGLALQSFYHGKLQLLSVTANTHIAASRHTLEGDRLPRIADDIEFRGVEDARTAFEAKLLIQLRYESLVCRTVLQDCLNGGQQNIRKCGG